MIAGGRRVRVDSLTLGGDLATLDAESESLVGECDEALAAIEIALAEIAA